MRELVLKQKSESVLNKQNQLKVTIEEHKQKTPGTSCHKSSNKLSKETLATKHYGVKNKCHGK